MLNEKTNVEQRMRHTADYASLIRPTDILDETEELIKIFVASIKTAEKKKK